ASAGPHPQGCTLLPYTTLFRSNRFLSSSNTTALNRPAINADLSGTLRLGMVQFRMKNPSTVREKEMAQRTKAPLSSYPAKLLLRTLMEATVDEMTKALPSKIGPSEMIVQ